ncbi:hypothetical protein [Veillonella sp.]|uniref:hypothetical protein n=1 Tax=Veillonella sp. TaxID=1926307 RepID=UPI0025CEC625|nr:hypothetical protein [Veillonella sp.]
MSDSDASLYDEVIEGLRCNRELEIYYNDSTYGIVTYGALWQLWKDEDLLAGKSVNKWEEFKRYYRAERVWITFNVKRPEL